METERVERRTFFVRVGVLVVAAFSGSLVPTGLCAQVKGTICTEAHLYEKVDMCCVKKNAPPLQDDVAFMFYESSEASTFLSPSTNTKRAG